MFRSPDVSKTKYGQEMFFAVAFLIITTQQCCLGLVGEGGWMVVEAKSCVNNLPEASPE